MNIFNRIKKARRTWAADKCYNHMEKMNNAIDGACCGFLDEKGKILSPCRECPHNDEWLAHRYQEDKIIFGEKEIKK